MGKRSKIPLIVAREYLTRVRKRSFLVMTLLGPLLMGAMFVVPAWLATMSDEMRKVVVVDNSLLFFRGSLKDSKTVSFDYSMLDRQLVEAQRIYEDSAGVSILFIPENILKAQAIVLESSKQPGLYTVNYVQSSVEKVLQDYKLIKRDIDPEVIRGTRTAVSITNKVGGDDSLLEQRLVVGFAAAMLIYMFIFIYSAQVMRGVMEEKTSRIIEVIVSSVRPFHLMAGKIVGVSLVGLTQFVLWIILTFGIVAAAESVMVSVKYDPAKLATSFTENAGDAGADQQKEISGRLDKAFESFHNINWPVIASLFIFYFIGGYLLYGSLFAAIGSAVDSETDTQQFMLPVTLPLILAIIVAMTAGLNNPEGPVAWWFSMIPLTSPVVMMVRIPFGIEWYDLALSGALLVLAFIGSTWLSGRIYRTGILMYGKKVSYRELWKWVRYGD